MKREIASAGVRPVTVAFLLPALPVGGAERQIASLVRGLDRARFRPVVAVQHARGPVAEAIEADGTPVRMLSDGRRIDPRFLLRTRALLRREKAGVVLSHGFSTGVVARIAALSSGTPVRILAEHSTGERDMTPGRHRINRLLAPLATAWVAVAHGQLPYLTGTKGIPADRIRVIPNGIDPAPFGRDGARERVRRELGLPIDAPVAGMVAVHRPEKDHRTFLDAARMVLNEIPEARFVLVGDGPLTEHLRREVGVLAMEDRVVFTGRRDDVPEVLSALDVSVLCSTDVETFPMAFLESMASSLPLVGTRVGGLPEMIEPESNGLLVEPRDSQGLSRAMLRVLGDPELARRWGDASRRRVEAEFGIDRMVAAYEDLFTELLGAAGVSVPNRSAAAG